MPYLTLDDGARLAYLAEGPAGAPVVVFSNSLGTNLHMWDAQAAALAPRRRVLRYDTRGHGGSSAPAGPYTLARLGRDLLALLGHLAIERADVCGLSLGGLTAQWLASTHPARVGRVVLANTGAQIGSAESWAARIGAVQAGGMAAIYDVVLARFLSAEFRAGHPAATAELGAMLLATDPQGYCAACAAVHDADMRPQLGDIAAPTLVVAGAHDEATPPALAEALHAAIAGSELAVLPAAHLSNIEQPEAFNQLLLRFLLGPDQRGGAAG